MSIFNDPKVMLWITCRQDTKVYTVELRDGDECLAVMAICPDCDKNLLAHIKFVMEEARHRQSSSWIVPAPDTPLAVYDPSVRNAELDAVAELLFPKAVAKLRARPRG